METSRNPTLISLIAIIDNGIEDVTFTEPPDDSDVLELRADDVSSLWSMGPVRAIHRESGEYWDGCFVFVTIIPVDGRIEFRVWVIDNQGHSVSYSEE